MIVFDVTNESSLNDVETWIDQLDVQCGKELPKVLIANKSDMLSPADLKQ